MMRMRRLPACSATCCAEHTRAMQLVCMCASDTCTALFMGICVVERHGGASMKPLNKNGVHGCLPHSVFFPENTRFLFVNICYLLK